ncbi:MAG: RNA methyltransferase [Bacteroidales bacterium]|jgi:tRNA (guanosine-2'-O-)-methyltransferase|nr:RNA methyltransferase [Bacteroidales bacterium]
MEGSTNDLVLPFFMVDKIMDADLIKHLEQFITQDRIALFRQVLTQRTRYITVVLEDIYQSQNASAVLRTADCFGIQDVHVIENKNKYQINPDVALGASKWLNLHKYNQQANNTLDAIHHLKSQGYRIVATTPHKHDVELEAFDLSRGKTALFFGTELKGLSQEMIDHADEYLKIPMMGFTESFNISVSAAIILYHLTSSLRKSTINWQLSDNEKQAVLLEWLKQSIKKSSLLIDDFLSKKKNF